MDDIDYAKYIIKKYIPFKNNGCRDKFISRYNKSNDNKESRVIQLVNIIINLSKNNNNTIIAEPVDKVILKKETKPINDKDDKLKKEINKLKKENDKLIKQNELLTNNMKQYDEDWINNEKQEQKERDKFRNEINNLENDIKQSNNIIDKYKTQIQNIKNAGLTKVLTNDDDITIPPNKPKTLTYKDFINNGLSVLDGDYSDDDEEEYEYSCSESDDEIQDELDKDLN